MLDQASKKRLEDLTVELLLALRSEYLRTGSANMLKHWDILQSRALSASKTCANPEEWATQIARKLQIPKLSADSSRCLVALANEVRERGCAADWLAMCEREAGMLMALCRLESERRKESRNADQTL